MVWGKAGSTTLSSAGDDLDITSMTASKFNQILGHHINSGSKAVNINFNGNSNSVYARRKSFNGGTDSTSTSQTTLNVNLNHSAPEFFISYVCDVTSEEKLMILFNTDTNTAGAGNAPTRQEYVAKFVPSPSARITRVDTNNDQSGSYDTDSNITALGSDLTPAAAVPIKVQDGAVFHETDTNKAYVLYNNTWSEL